VTGKVFHLLPNNDRTENAVATLRGGQQGPVQVRVTYPNQEAKADPKKLAFTVDGTSGKSQIVVIHSDGPLFSALDPREVSVQAFAEALERRVSEGGANVLSIDSRLLETR
jgi:serine/threonine-protein kinase